MLKTVLVHDWLTGMRGGERVLEAMYECYPSPVYTLIHTKGFKSSIIPDSRVNTSFLQKIPLSGKLYQKMLALFPKAVEEFDLSGFDVVLSSSHAVAKGVLSHSNQLHICYMHTPIRYAWDLTFQYLRQSGLDKGLLSWYAKSVLHNIRTWDIISANRADYLIANSAYIARRIKKVYGRDSEVIHPPVNTDYYTPAGNKDNYYLTASQMVPYKKIDIIVECFKKLPDRKLLVIGKGPEFKKIQKLAAGAKNIELAGYQPDDVLREAMRKAKAYIFAAEEDFGIIPVEAQASGTPVIAFGRGGAMETVQDGKTGVFFQEQTSDSLKEAVIRFEKLEDGLDPAICRKNAENFSRAVFLQKYRGFVEAKMQLFFENRK